MLLRKSSASCIVGVRITVKALKLSAVCPGCTLASVCRGVANLVVLKDFTVVREKSITRRIIVIIQGSIRILAKKRLFFQSEAVDILRYNITVIIISKESILEKVPQENEWKLKY